MTKQLCPHCNRIEPTKVVQTWQVGEGAEIYRRRKCFLCNGLWTTEESLVTKGKAFDVRPY